MSKSEKNNKYQIYQVAKPGKQGAILQMSLTQKGTLFFTLAKQIQNQERMVKFDYENAAKTGFSDTEAAEIILAIDMTIHGEIPKDQLKFPHYESSVPKNIFLTFSEYNGKPQCQFAINIVEGPTYSIYLTKDEMYVLKCNLEAQINLYSRRTIVDIVDNEQFKDFASGQLNRI